MTTAERRRFSRIDFDAQVELHQDNQTCKAELVDISLKGLLLIQLENMQLKKDQPVQVKILLSDKTFIAMSADIAHQSVSKSTNQPGHQLGLVFTLIDIDSISHLRRLIELNLGDPSAAERELVELIGASVH